MHLRVHICACARARMHACMYALCMCVRACVCVRVCACVCVCVCVCVCMCLCVCGVFMRGVQCMYACMHVCMYVTMRACMCAMYVLMCANIVACMECTHDCMCACVFMCVRHVYVWVHVAQGSSSDCSPAVPTHGHGELGNAPSTHYCSSHLCLWPWRTRQRAFYTFFVRHNSRTQTSVQGVGA